MQKRARVFPLLCLVVIMLVAGIAATPAQLAPPSQPIVVATDNPGELQMTWSPVPGAQHYTVGYASPDEMERMAAAGRNRLDAFYYATIGAENTNHTFTGLEPETVYWVTAGAHTPRFRATDLVWASQHAVATTAGEHRETIIFGDLNWSSALTQTRIAQYIVEKGYGYPTDVRFGATLPLFQGLRSGDIDVLMELWLPNRYEAWSAGQVAGEVYSPGASLGKDWQSAFVIPAYLQEQYPELDSVEDLKDPQYRELFATAETGGKARLVSCVISWACATVNATQVEGYGLSDHVHIVNPGDGAALNADLYSAYDRGELWLGYQWGTNGPALLLDVVRLEEPAYSDECWFTTRACAYEDATILIAVNPDLAGRAPDVIEMLRKWDFAVDPIYKGIVRWQDANPDADVNATAIWWLNNNADTWEQWVTDAAATSIHAALEAGATPDGWPDQ